MTSLSRYFFVFLLISAAATFAGNARFQVTVPKIAYTQWLGSPTASVQRTRSGPQKFRFSAGRAQEQSAHLGILCNSLAGYEVRLRIQSSSAQGEAFTYEVLPLYSTLQGAQPIVVVDNQTNEVVIRVTFSSAQSLPLQAARPNVFQLKIQPTSKDLDRAVDVWVTPSITLY